MKLIAVGQARLNSVRSKNKMLRPYANTTLVELAVKKLSCLENFDEVYFGAYEAELLEVARKHLPLSSIRIRTEEMANSEDMMISYGWLRDIDFDYCMWINSCHGLLKAETLDQAASTFRNEGYKSMTSVRKYYTGFYDEAGKPVNDKEPAMRDGKVYQRRTQDTSPLYGIANAFHVFEREHFFNTNTYWNNSKNDPFLYEINHIESLDVDTEDDFLISESVYNSLHS
jgi:N-acylneuraminate cytidylyltransferase